MKCHVCGATMRATRSDLPFKTSEQTIVILKGLPVLQCENCAEYSSRTPSWRASTRLSRRSTPLPSSKSSVTPLDR